MRLNKGVIILIIVVIIAILVYIFSNPNGTLGIGNNSFAIENIEDINQIKISRGENTVSLEKLDENWMVNASYHVNKRTLITFLEVLSRIDILAPASKAENQTIASKLKQDGILVEIYKNQRIRKKYYVSSPDISSAKTYMMLYKSSEPYIVHIPGHNTFIAAWFIADEYFWRDKTVFNLSPQDIQRIQVNYPYSENKSFTINTSTGEFKLSDYTKNNIDDFDPEKISRYLTYFNGITFEQFATGITKEQKDSILATNPIIRISLQSFSGLETNLKIYRKPADTKTDEFGQAIEFDVNKAYGILNDSKEFILIQYYIFDPIFKEIDYFR